MNKILLLIAFAIISCKDTKPIPKNDSYIGKWSGTIQNDSSRTWIFFKNSDSLFATVDHQLYYVINANQQLYLFDRGIERGKLVPVGNKLEGTLRINGVNRNLELQPLKE